MKKQQPLIKDIKEHSVSFLMSDEYAHKATLSSAIQQLPEYLALIKGILRQDFFFAAFEQTASPEGTPPKTGPKDIEKFILERLKNSLATPRENYEFVVETDGKVIGYVELFDPKTIDGKKQYERGVFIIPDQQAAGYGKEAIIALTHYAFKTLAIDRIFTMVDPDNTRSLNNIINNSGGVKIGEEESKYSHLNGGGKQRLLFHIYPEHFYKALHDKGNDVYIGTNDNAAPKLNTKMKGQ